MAKVLIVEDDPETAEALQEGLKGERHSVEIVFNGADGLAMLQSYTFDLAIVDWQMPQMTGVELVKAYRKKGGTVPVLLLTAKSHVDDKSDGLDAGADDYLTKPFLLKELTARVRALLRRPANVSATTLTVGELTLEPASGKVHRGSEEIRLLPMEFSLLEFLMRHPNSFHTSNALLESVWKSDSDATVIAVRTTMMRLRRKIDLPNQPSFIDNQAGFGYRIRTTEASSKN